MMEMLALADNNWLELPIDKVIKSVLNYFESLKSVEVIEFRSELC